MSSLSSPSSFRREFPSSFCKSRERVDEVSAGVTISEGRGGSSGESQVLLLCLSQVVVVLLI